MQITLKEAVEKLKSGGVYSLKVVAADLKRKTGGDILVISKAKYALSESKKTAKASNTKKAEGRNATWINIWDGQNARIIKIHVRLMVEFDGKEIIW